MSINADIFDKYKKRLGARIKHLRTSKGYSLNDLATLCDMEKTSISRIENGRTNITFKTALYLCKGLNVPLKDLFDIPTD